MPVVNVHKYYSKSPTILSFIFDSKPTGNRFPVGSGLTGFSGRDSPLFFRLYNLDVVLTKSTTSLRWANARAVTVSAPP
jgi:hypothetical protein